MPPTSPMTIDLGPALAKLPVGCSETTRFVFADDDRKVLISRFADEAETPEAFSRQRQGRAAEVTGGAAVAIVKEGRMLDGHLAFLTVYRGTQRGRTAETAFLVLQLRPGRYALVQVSGSAIQSLVEPMVASVRFGSKPADPVPRPLAAPQSFGEFSMSLPVGMVRRTPFTAEDAAAGISWRIDAEPLNTPSFPSLAQRLPRSPEVDVTGRATTDTYRRDDRVGSITIAQTIDPELAVPGPVLIFAEATLRGRVRVHLEGRGPAAARERLARETLLILHDVTLTPGGGE